MRRMAAGGLLAGALLAAMATAGSASTVEVSGRQVDLLCKGEGGRTVFIETGGGTPAERWREVQDRIAAFARVCAYDRPGYGDSEPAPAGRTVADRADDLWQVIKASGEPGPFVLVAHSYGGLIVRQLVLKHSRDIAGLVLVDTAEEQVAFAPESLKYFDDSVAQVAALRAKISAGDGAGRKARELEYDALIDEGASYHLVPPAMRRAGGFGRLGHRPLVVIAHGRPFIGPAAPLESGWRKGQERLAALSSRGRLIVAERSDHNIQFTQPELIAQAVKDVEAALAPTP